MIYSSFKILHFKGKVSIEMSTLEDKRSELLSNACEEISLCILFVPIKGRKSQRKGGCACVHAYSFYKRKTNLSQNESYLHSTYNCFLPLPLSLFGPFSFPFFIFFAVFFPLQPFMLIFLIAVVSRRYNLIINGKHLNFPEVQMNYKS